MDVVFEPKIGKILPFVFGAIKLPQSRFVRNLAGSKWDEIGQNVAVLFEFIK